MEQAPLCEYNFEVQNVVADLQDGIHLCRLAQLMSQDVSVLVVPPLSNPAPGILITCHMKSGIGLSLVKSHYP
jgi:hypothetical protein